MNGKHSYKGSSIVVYEEMGQTEGKTTGESVIQQTITSQKK